jgi:hypothetical protein
MNARTHIPEHIQHRVLDRSRRRCALCVHFNNDRQQKEGQIAHLDRDPSNFAEDNLAFFCLLHHDDYDTKRRQTKNLTIREAKTARDRLYAFIEGDSDLATAGRQNESLRSANQSDGTTAHRLHLPQWRRSRIFTKAIATTGPLVFTLGLVYLVFLEFWPHPSTVTSSAEPTKIPEIAKWMDVPAAIEAFVPVALKDAYDQSVKQATHLQEEIEEAQGKLVAPSGFPMAQGKAAEDLRYQILEFRNELAVDKKQQEQAQNAIILYIVSLFKAGDLFARGYDQKTDKWVYVLPNEWEYLQLVPRTGALTEDSMAIIGGLAGRTNLVWIQFGKPVARSQLG